MAAAPTLRELQHELEILFSLGGEPGYEARLESAAATLPIARDDRLSPAERVGIYTGMIFLRIRDAIAEDFPATLAALGEGRWDETIAAYLRAHPTDHPDLRMAARFLPAFLRRSERGPIADLADLEWALVDSFTAGDAAPLRPEALQALAPEEWPELEIRVVPSLRLLEPRSACDRNRKALLEGADAPLDEEAPFPLRLWRRDLRVFHKRIEPLECEALARAAQGTSFADLCEWLADAAPDREPSEAAVGLLQTWLADELLAARS